MSAAIEWSIDMLQTCDYAFHMSKMIQLRNVPDGLHRILKARAAMAGKSLSDYLIGEVERIAARPTPEELRERLQQRSRVFTDQTSAEILRSERDRE